jgi:trans-aconitate 2-methyltransferase
MSNWDPDLYERFQQQRRQPFYDLLELVEPRPGMRIVDLGCGPGPLTKILHETLEARDTLGIDSSETMLARARPLATDRLRFIQSDIAALDDRGVYDLVFSNAALHWVADHRHLFARLTAALRGGGQLAVQVPTNKDHASHQVIAQIARRASFRSALDGYEGARNVLPAEDYSVLLHDFGYRDQRVRLQVYAHLLPSRDDVVEWVRGTTLTAFQERLGPELFERFLAEYREALAGELPDQRPFFYTFKRLLIWAKR